MAKILIFSELNKNIVKPVTLEIMGKLSKEDIEIAIIGNCPQESKEILSKHGAKKIHQINSDKLDIYSPEGYSEGLKELISSQDYKYIFAGATALVKDFFPRLAGMLDSGMVSEVINFDLDSGEFNGVRPIFAGKCLAKVSIKGPTPHFITVRPNSLGLPQSTNQNESTLENFTPTISELRATVKEIISGTSERLDLTEANIIVSGGRAMKNAENFKILNQLAETLGATVGASRAAVDSGYAPHAMQVGQTGKTVSPTLYIACGISGAIQHLAGMRTSKIIVAINTDPDAPIFTKADYGIVGDLFQIVPIMTEEFKKILN